MKRILCLLLSALILLCLMGCQSADSNTVPFYYCCNPQSNTYFNEDSVIRSEVRDLMGHRNDLQYMLGLYLAGPMDEELIPPFSKQTKLLSVHLQNEEILIELSDHTASLSDSEFSLSCACLSLTCMDFITCSSITVVSGERSVTMTHNNIILQDILPAQEDTGG